jgi:hypothetical protein
MNNNFSNQGITKEVLKKIEIGACRPGGGGGNYMPLFKNKRSLSNPLDYASSDFESKSNLF